jgi:hypothetical protein
MNVGPAGWQAKKKWPPRNLELPGGLPIRKQLTVVHSDAGGRLHFHQVGRICFVAKSEGIVAGEEKAPEITRHRRSGGLLWREFKRRSQLGGWHITSAPSRPDASSAGYEDAAGND